MGQPGSPFSYLTRLGGEIFKAKPRPSPIRRRGEKVWRLCSTSCSFREVFDKVNRQRDPRSLDSIRFSSMNSSVDHSQTITACPERLAVLRRLPQGCGDGSEGRWWAGP